MSIKFCDTRNGRTTDLAFSDVIIAGISETGGLFVPDTLPTIDDVELAALADMPYWEQATFVYEKFGVDFCHDHIAAIMQDAYGSQWATDEIAPITTLDEGIHVLELTHGPTSAFKDIALQCMPRFLSAAIEKQHDSGKLDNDLLILVATSGDTGKAALDGFADRANTSIIVFYPIDGVSDLQKTQMITQAGGNVGVFGVRGNFDDCQSAVKLAFADGEFSGWLENNGELQLSSANSINWGRLMPQIAYYISACARLRKSGELADGALLDVSVPTGNFGNILGAYYAKLMGAPIGRLMCGSNSNDVLTDFLATGTYDISGRPFHITPSPSMDILISSNLERLLYHVAGAKKTAKWMAELASKKKYTVDGKSLGEIQSLFVGRSIDSATSLSMIKRCWDAHQYLIDPHTAVALQVALTEKQENPVLVVATAHWAKFAANVLRALTETPAGVPLSAPYREHGDFMMLDDVVALAPGCAPIPANINALRNAQTRFTSVIHASVDAIEDVVRKWVQSCQ